MAAVVGTPNTLLFTKHGSHLYGLAHAASDEDWFRVVDSGTKTKQSVIDGQDNVVTPIDRFMENIFSGSHQSCEALFSPYAEVDPRWKPLFDSWRVTGEDAFAKYRRTIHAFSYGTPKQKRHAMRLGYNLADLRRSGRFNPVMTDGQKTMATVVSQLYSGQSLYDIAINL